MPGVSCSLRDAAADCSNAVHYRLILAQVRGLRFTALMVQGALCRLNCRQRGREAQSTKNQWWEKLLYAFNITFISIIMFSCSEFVYPPNFFLNMLRKFSNAFSGMEEVTRYPGILWAFKMDFLVCISSSHWYPLASSNTPTPLAFLMQCYCWSKLGLKHWARVFDMYVYNVNSFTAIQHTGMSNICPICQNRYKT